MTAPPPTAGITAATAAPPLAWRAARRPVLAGLGFVVVLGLLALLLPSRPSGTLDPRSYSPGGSHALAVLLAERGVTVTRVDTIPAATAALSGGPATLVITRPGDLGVQAATLADGRAGEVVLLEPDPAVTGLFAPPVKLLDPGDGAASRTATTRLPGCDLPAAVAAGRVLISGAFALPPGAGTGCYAGGSGPALVRLPATATTGGLTLIADATALTNAALSQQGDAALGLALLGEHTRVVWLVPSGRAPDAAVGGSSGLLGLLPPGVPAAAWTLALAAGVLALARGRRLGPLVAEPLPVVVRAAEAARGRGRLYQAARARGRAAEALRAGARARWRTALGLAPGTGTQYLLDSLAAATGRPAGELAELVAGPAPTDDRALVALADALDRVDAQLGRRSG